MNKKLGRGLEALMPQEGSKPKEKVEMISPSAIIPNEYQPRKVFNEDRMTELIESIREKGVIQPVLVRRKDDMFELIAGERRWRAVKELQLTEIPVLIKEEIDNVNSLEISLIENIQRENINPIEEAQAYKRLIDEFNYTLDQIGKEVGKNKTTVSNSLRLLSLSKDIQDSISAGSISVGHAKVLLSVMSEKKRTQLAKMVRDHGISVRNLERIIKADEEKILKPKKIKDPNIVKIEEDLQQHLGTKVAVSAGKKRGKIEIHYYSNDDLLRVMNIITKC